MSLVKVTSVPFSWPADTREAIGITMRLSNTIREIDANEIGLMQSLLFVRIV